LDEVALIVSDGAEAITSAAAMVYPGAAHQLCLAHWFRLLEDLTPAASTRPMASRSWAVLILACEQAHA
jgi:transposase-like protein